MSKKKEKKPFDPEHMTPEEQLKFEIAEELGLGDRVLKDGWRCLTSKESGRIGGLITKQADAKGNGEKRPGLMLVKPPKSKYNKTDYSVHKGVC